MANFISLVYGTLQGEGIDTSKMSTDEAIQKFNELTGKKNARTETKGTVSADTRAESVNKVASLIANNMGYPGEENEVLKELSNPETLEEFKEYYKNQISDAEQAYRTVDEKDRAKYTKSKKDAEQILRLLKDI